MYDSDYKFPVKQSDWKYGQSEIMIRLTYGVLYSVSITT